MPGRRRHGRRLKEIDGAGEVRASDEGALQPADGASGHSDGGTAAQLFETLPNLSAVIESL